MTLVADCWLRTPPSRCIRAIQVPAALDVADILIVQQTTGSRDAAESGYHFPITPHIQWPGTLRGSTTGTAGAARVTP